MRMTACIISFILIVGCAAEKSHELPEHLNDLGNLTVFPADEEPVQGIGLIQETTFGDTDEVFLGRIIETIAVDDAGRVFIADMTENTIHAYNPDGSYLQRIGREGQGPGEFQGIRDLKIQNDQIHVLDSQQFKISVFDLDSFQHMTDYDISLGNQQNGNPSWLTWTREEGLVYRPAGLFVRSDGLYLVLFSDEGVGSAHNVEGRTFEVSLFSPADGKYTEHDLLSFRWSGQVLVHEEGDGMIVMFRVPYKRSSQFDFTNDQFVIGWTEEKLFKFYDQHGAYQRAFYYPHSNIQLDLNDVLAYYYEEAGEQIIRAIRNDERPETWPAFHSLKVDDENRLWVSTIVNDLEVYEWRVIGADGERLAAFTWPRNRNLQQVKNGYVYTIERDLETDLLEVVRYRIEVEM
jgi:hypothetical protein